MLLVAILTTMSTKLRAALVEALESAPCSLRALAREAGVSHTALQRIQTGDLKPTPALAFKVAAALQSWSDTCGASAARLRSQAQKETA